MRSLALLISFLFLLTGCQEPIFQSLKKTDELFVHEGLPHPLREFASFEKEKKRDDVRQIEGHWFYDEKVKVSGETRDRLMNLLFDESGFRVPGPNAPQKDCGPFHPDYAIMWKSGGAENYLMLCYTCSEAKLIKDGKTTSYDLVNGTKKAWQKVLSEFQSHRPQS